MATVPTADGTLLWVADTAALDDAGLGLYAGWLGTSERRRCERFLRPRRRRQFIAGRALLRIMLARLLELAPAAIVLDERPGNAPRLAGVGLPAVGFSISHSGPWVACAASLHGPVGLDIECIDAGRDVVALAEQVFDAATAAQVRGCAGAARLQAFYRHWCLYEAGIKLGEASAADHVYTHRGLALALRCARPLAAPRLDIVDLGAGMPGP